MKKILIMITMFFLILYNNSRLFPEELTDTSRLLSGEALVIEALSPEIREAIAQFSLKRNYQQYFSINKYNHFELSLAKDKKNYWSAGLKVAAVNIIVWAYDVFVLDAGWAKISLGSILNNFKYGYEWDNNSFKTNQFEHPYHGALYYSGARVSGLNFWESLIYPFLGSFMWEFFMETNRPSATDHIMTTLGGISLGEILFRIAELTYNNDSRGFQKSLQHTLVFLINPVYGFSIITRKGNKMRRPLERHYYDLNIGFGLYSSFTQNPKILIAATLEYKDAFKGDNHRIKPYDYFSSKFKLGFNNSNNFDYEILTTGLLTGKKTKTGIVGLFGVFDYINTHFSEKASSVGVGPGLIILLSPKSNLFLNASSVFSGIFGGSHSSLDLNYQRLVNAQAYPYLFGPGTLGRIEIEIGKRGLGSVQAGVSRHCVRSIRSPLNESLVTLYSYLKFELSKKSQISFEYDVFFRHANHSGLHFSSIRDTAYVTYITKF